MTLLRSIAWFLLAPTSSHGFQPFQMTPLLPSASSRSLLFAKKQLAVLVEPVILDASDIVVDEDNMDAGQHFGLAMAAAMTVTTASPDWAAALDLKSFQGGMTPETFQPVCSTSDGFYRLLQDTTAGLVGKENYAEYGPLISGGLLRIRLELCVVESFFSEAVVPFIRDNGLSWVLPLHETIETFIAGVIFAIATTFILVGSTKLLTVIVTYTDFLLGLPSRLFGGYAFDRAMGKPVTLDIGFGPFKTRIVGPPADKEENKANLDNASIPQLALVFLSGIVNYFGKALGLLREGLEAIDTFVGRYLVLWATLYLIIKFVHFKIFPNFP